MRDRALVHRGLYPDDPQIIVSEALFFEPGYPSSRPLQFIQDLFDWRASLPKEDMRGQVIKLGINSVYGKFAQRVGRPGEPPAYASLWYAAAITAGTRRKLMEAALTDPSAIIAFATDAVFCTRPLPIAVPDRKILGEWEFARHDAGSFVQSGVYSMRDIGEGGKMKIKAASRGFAPKQEQDEMGAAQDFVSALDQDLFVDVPQIWRDGGDVLNFEDDEYIGLGRAVVSPKTWPDIGSWKTYDRELKLNSMSTKRRVPQGSKRLQSRADKLIALEIEPYTHNPRLGLTGMLEESEPAIPDWHWAAKVKRSRSPAGDGGEDDANVNAKFACGDDE
jgi:hypothetical protein